MTITTDETEAAEPKAAPLTLAEARALQAYAWPDVWAANLRLKVDSSAFDLTGREYLVGILRDESPSIVNPKGAQMGLTTAYIVKSCHSVVQRGWTVLYLLPVKAGSVTFVQSRIDPMIDSNKKLEAEFKRVDNRNQKVTVRGTRWYVRGTNVESELREAPADILVIDERDVANEDNLPDAYARLDGSAIQRAYELSTPTIEGYGVYGDNAYPASDQMQWWVPCPGCGTKQVLTFEDNVEPYLGNAIEECEDACRCCHCQRPFSDSERAAANALGTWVPANPGASLRGYHISQLNSPTKKLADPTFGILVRWFAGQTDSKQLKAFHNLALGLGYAAPGDKFTKELLDRQRGDYSEGVMTTSQILIGIDQGVESLHVTIWSRDGNQRRLLKAILVRPDDTRKKWQVLDEDVLQVYPNWTAVCDAHPDKEDAEELSKKYPGRFWVGFEKDRPDQVETANFSRVIWGEPCEVRIDRTAAFDSYVKSFMEGRSWLPREAQDMGEEMPGKTFNGLYHHHLQMVRVNQYDTAGRLTARWVNGGEKKTTPRARASGNSKSGNRPDHWHHSGMFALVAGMVDAPLIVTAEVGNLFQAAGNLIGRKR